MFLNLLADVLSFISKIIGWLYNYRIIYSITGLFTTRKFPNTEKRYKYAILIAARNEETVITNLLDSIHRQDYDGEVTTFVVADNCTDRTKFIMVNKRVRNAVLGCNLKNDRMISVHFQGKPFSITVIQVYAPTSNAEEAEVEWFYEDLPDLRTNTQNRCPFHYKGLECKSRKSRNTWSNRQILPWSTE